MDMRELKMVIREHYPLPIAHAHKKTLGVLDEGVEKLTCLDERPKKPVQQPNSKHVSLLPTS